MYCRTDRKLRLGDMSSGYTLSLRILVGLSRGGSIMNAIILAGGKSSRFGSNKALYKINQKPMLVNIVEKLSPIFKKIYIIGDQKDKYEEIRGTVYLRDKIPDKGPLGGLYTGLSVSGSQYNYLQACDMPFVSQEYLRYMKGHIISNKNYEAFIPEKNGYLEPFVGIYDKNIMDKILELIKKEKLNFDNLFEKIKIKKIDEEEIAKIADTERIFFNINKKEDLAKYKNIKVK